MPEIDNTDMTPLKRLEQLRGDLERERTTWIDHWRELSEYILPRRGRFLTSDANKGGKRNQKVINSTATYNVGVMSSGMMSGITSPARPWFALSAPDDDLNDFGPVRNWLDEVTRRMRELFLRSNLYNVLPAVYSELGCFGTSPIIAMEHPEKTLMFHQFTIGSYSLALNKDGMVDTLMRPMSMTVSQVVTKFGLEVCSKVVQDAWKNGRYNQRVQVTHCIGPNYQYNAKKLGAERFPFMSVYYENKQVGDNKVLRYSGFNEQPFMAPRWDVTAEEAYGSCPGMTALGDVRSLQVYETHKAIITEKLGKPPMGAPASMERKRVSNLPGDYTFFDQGAGGQKITPLYEVSPQALLAVKDAITEHERRIDAAFYKDLFLMLANTNRSNITAREIDERHEEKLLMLGPVLERVNTELLDPLIDRTFNVMLRNGMLPRPPQELEDTDLKVEYISIMAQAQKMVGLAGVDRLTAFVASAADINPEALDRFNIDQAVETYADMTGVPPALVRSDDEVDAIRAQRQEQAAAQQQAEMAQQGARAVKDLASAPVSGDNALSAVLDGAVAADEVL